MIRIGLRRRKFTETLQEGIRYLNLCMSISKCNKQILKLQLKWRYGVPERNHENNIY